MSNAKIRARRRVIASQKNQATLMLHGWRPVRTYGEGLGVWHPDHGTFGRTKNGTPVRFVGNQQPSFCEWGELNSYRTTWIVKRLEKEGLL